MTRLRGLIRATLVGGIIFLIPLVFVVAFFGKAFQIMKAVATPVGKLIPYETLAGFIVVDLLTILIIILCCLMAGMLARSPWGRRVNARLDAALLQVIPAYAWVKGMTGGLRDEDAEDVLKPVQVRFDDQLQLGFEVDRAEDGLVAVYLPGSPDPRSGSVSFVSPDRVQSVDVGVQAVSKIYKNLGRGSTNILPSQTER
jgi:uncharacterized membrane protein